MEDGYHVISIPANVDDKRLATVAFKDMYPAYNVARTLSAYNHKSTQVVECKDGQCVLVYLFIDGQTREWF